MAIADKLTKLSTDITNAYTAIDNKGGTIPANKNTDNLASSIGSISTGTTPTGTKQISITANGTITEDVTNYANAEITTNVPMSAPKVEGTFTLVSQGQTPTIEHNLGTTKICAIIYPGGRIKPTRGYQEFFCCFVNVNDIMDNDTWGLDFTGYNSGQFSDVTYVDKTERNANLRASFTHQAPWTTQSSWYQANNNPTPDNSQYTVTESTFETNIRTYGFAPGTYKYIIFALN